ncbi:MAG: hypothetical protein E7328_01555 [Clostridiales bacterium]|nr:hypothetical protein [Clostridiales bacterium]
MKKTLALLLAILMMALMLTGCQINREKDMAQVVLEVGDVSYTKAELYEKAEAYLYSQGTAIDLMDEEMDESLRAAVDTFIADYLEYLFQIEVACIIVDRDMPLTEDELKEVNDSVDEYVDFVKEYMLEDHEEAEGEEHDEDAHVDEYFVQSYGMTVAEYREESIRVAKLDKLGDSIIDGVTADDEAVKAMYEADLKTQKEAAINGETYYESETMADGSTIGAYTLHKAHGYRLVKHILFSFTDEQMDEIEDAEVALEGVKLVREEAEEDKQAAETVKAAAETAKAEAEEAEDTEKAAAQQKIIDEQNKIIAEKEALIQSQTVKVNKAQADFHALRNNKAKALMAKANAVYARLEKGEDFDALLKEYGEDPGMKSVPFSVLGYLISPAGTGFDETFVDAAQQLKEVGEFSKPVVSNFGVHIVKLTYGEEEADLPYEMVKEVVQPYADSVAQDEAFEAGMKKYAEELGGKIHPDRVTYVK